MVHTDTAFISSAITMEEYHRQGGQQARSTPLMRTVTPRKIETASPMTEAERQMRRRHERGDAMPSDTPVADPPDRHAHLRGVG